MDKILDQSKKHAFAGWPMIIFWIGVFVFAIHASTHMVGAGDTWVALACGRHYINHKVDTVEPFSANSHKPGPTDAQLEKFPDWLHGTIKKWHPTGWINQNWLTHVVFYKMKTVWGENSIVIYKFVQAILTALFAYWAGRKLGAHPILAAATAAFGMLLSRSFTKKLLPVVKMILNKPLKLRGRWYVNGV